jgi:hypothetical protein
VPMASPLSTSMWDRVARKLLCKSTMNISMENFELGKHHE